MAPTDSSSSLVACMSRRRSSIVSPLIINKSMDDLSSGTSNTRPDSPAVSGFKRVPKKFKPTLQIVIPENQLELNNAAAMSAVSTDGVQPVPQDSSSDKNSSGFYSSSTRYGNGRGSFRKQIDVSIYIPRRLGGGYAMF